MQQCYFVCGVLLYKTTGIL